MDDRRNAQRYPINLPLEIKAEEALAVETRNVSFRGLYFVAEREFQSGSPIEFVLTLPRELTLAGDVRIYCAGRIVRVEKPQPTGPVGIAAVIDRYEFLSQPS